MKPYSQNSIRPKMLLGFSITLVMIATALFFQYELELDPCPLCISQRIIIMGVGLLFLLAAIQGPKSWGIRIYGFFLALTSGLGLLVSGRHIWLQHLPEDKVPECGPGLDFWINNLPVVEVIKKLFQGTGECAEVLFTFMGLSIPEWTFIAFTLFFIFSLKLLFNTKSVTQ